MRKMSTSLSVHGGAAPEDPPRRRRQSQRCSRQPSAMTQSPAGPGVHVPAEPTPRRTSQAFTPWHPAPTHSRGPRKRPQDTHPPGGSLQSLAGRGLAACEHPCRLTAAGRVPSPRGDRDPPTLCASCPTADTTREGKKEAGGGQGREGWQGQRGELTPGRGRTRLLRSLPARLSPAPRETRGSRIKNTPKGHGAVLAPSARPRTPAHPGHGRVPALGTGESILRSRTARQRPSQQAARALLLRCYFFIFLISQIKREGKERIRILHT